VKHKFFYKSAGKNSLILRTARPTAPSPNTATVEPLETFAVFHAAPTPDAKEITFKNGIIIK
jgi:hypothetical protein